MAIGITIATGIAGTIIVIGIVSGRSGASMPMSGATTAITIRAGVTTTAIGSTTDGLPSESKNQKAALRGGFF